MGNRQVETVITFEKARKRLVEAMVASYLKHNPGGHARVVSKGNASWIKPDGGPPPSWREEQVRKIHDLAEEYEAVTPLAPENAVLRWGPHPDGMELWFEEKTAEHLEGSVIPPSGSAT
jgi:hypothetical protein